MSKRPPEGDGAAGSKQPRLGEPANGVAGDAAAQPESKPLPLDIPTLNYKEGRLAKEIIFQWKSNNTSLLVCIAPEYMVGSNKQVKSRQLWGEDVYTDDSDLVAVLLHLGYHASNAAAPNPLVSRFYAQIALLPPREAYPSCFRNAVRSRGWFSQIEGCSYKVERCWLVTRSNKQLELAPRADDCAITHPTFALSNSGPQMSTRSTAGSSRNKPVTEVTVLYNLCHEPWLKYSMSSVADRGLKSSHWTSSRLREEVIYMETSRHRFELSYAGTAGPDDAQVDTYTFARCKHILPVSAVKQLGVPLPADEVEVLEAALDWDDLQWANMSMSVRGTPYKMLRMHFMPRCKPGQ
ncbi:rxt3 [Scenedesmus sp. PABB004]|nr:rxt3 [Scenedesmus sp. PABB004]